MRTDTELKLRSGAGSVSAGWCKARGRMGGQMRGWGSPDVQNKLRKTPEGVKLLKSS